MKNRFAVTGYKGKLGSLLIKREGFVALDCDITSHNSVSYALSKLPDIEYIVNCAAISSIDWCEGDPQAAHLVNFRGVAVLHDVFGSNILNISTDQVFPGQWRFFLPDENTNPSPVNRYGFSKMGAEAVSSVSGGKTIRLSRTVSNLDADINDYMIQLMTNGHVSVPSFFYRNYIHREFAVDGIEFFVKNWDNMPRTVHYGSLTSISMHKFISMLAKGFDVDGEIDKRRAYYSNPPRPKRGGLSVKLAKSLGFPMYSIADTVSRMVRDLYG